MKKMCTPVNPMQFYYIKWGAKGYKLHTDVLLSCSEVCVIAGYCLSMAVILTSPTFWAILLTTGTCVRGFQPGPTQTGLYN